MARRAVSSDERTFVILAAPLIDGGPRAVLNEPIPDSTFEGEVVVEGVFHEHDTYDAGRSMITKVSRFDPVR